MGPYGDYADAFLGEAKHGHIYISEDKATADLKPIGENLETMTEIEKVFQKIEREEDGQNSNCQLDLNQKM